MNEFSIEAISFILGERSISIRDEFPQFAKVLEKTGIETVHETSTSALNMAEAAVTKLLVENPILKNSAGALIYVTQSPTNYLPSGACTLQNLVGLPSSVLAFDMGQGCSGFVQALTLSARLVSTFKNIIIVCADTYRSKIEKTDRSTASVFSDAASATWISARPSSRIKAESNYCDGSGGQFLYHKIPNGPSEYLHMSGADVLLFAKNVIPREVERLLNLSQLASHELDFAFFHQASQLVLDILSERFNQVKCIPNNLKNVGNTTSSSIPILLSSYLSSINESLFLMSGFGVGLSASSVIVERA